MSMPDTAKTVENMTGTREHGRDSLNIDARLSEEEIALRDRVRAFVREQVKPNVNGWFGEAVFPREIVPEFAELGLLGMHLKGYGCAGRSSRCPAT